MANPPSMYQESLRAFLKPILKYLDDPSVSEIMINGPEEIWIEAKGKVTLTDAKFSEDALQGAARNMAQFVGRQLGDERPRLDARLPDGSRIHIVLPPIARKGTTISIRKFMPGRPGIEKLIEWGSMTAQMAYLIKAMVHTKLNIVVSGGTGSGKTTLLNIVSTLIPNDERILTIEDSAELQLQQEHIVPFESRPADKFGKGEVNMGHLLQSALRLRPDRIVVGEVRGGEAFDLVQAMNTGHGGSMATTHANTPTDTLRRIESLCLMSSVEMPMVAIRAQVASAINGIVCCERFHDGSRRTTAIAEVLPLNDKGEYRSQNLFVYVPTHKDKEGRVHGYHSPTGILPTFLGRMRAHGFADIDESFFDPETYGLPPPPAFYSENFETRWAPSLKHRERGEPDSKELQERIAAAAEAAEQVEREHKEKVKAGTHCGGYVFVDQPGAPHAPAAPEASKPSEPLAVTPVERAATEPRPHALERAAAAALAEQAVTPTGTAMFGALKRTPPASPPAAEPVVKSAPQPQPEGMANAATQLNAQAMARHAAKAAAESRQAPARPERSPQAEGSTIELAEHLRAGAEEFDNTLQHPAQPRTSSGPHLPPGKRPLPPGKRPLPAKASSPEDDLDATGQHEPPPQEDGNRTMIRGNPLRRK